MTWADFKCNFCDRQEFLQVGDEGPCPAYVPNSHNDVDRCPGDMQRVWTPVAIGSVQGAGGSPARSGT